MTASFPRRWPGIAPLVMLLLLLLALVPASRTGAEDRVNHAGVIVRQADGSFVYGYVAFTEPELDGFDLLKRSGIPLVTLDFGGLGSAICSVDGQGCGVAECRRNVCQSRAGAPYWQYFRQDDAGTWSPLLVGASATKVRDGDIDGWSWTAQDPALPAITLAELATLAGADPALAPGADGTASAWRRTADAAATSSPNASTGMMIGAGTILAVLGGGAVAAAMRRCAKPDPDPGTEAA